MKNLQVPRRRDLKGGNRNADSVGVSPNSKMERRISGRKFRPLLQKCASLDRNQKRNRERKTVGISDENKKKSVTTTPPGCAGIGRMFNYGVPHVWRDSRQHPAISETASDQTTPPGFQTLRAVRFSIVLILESVPASRGAPG